MNGEVEGVKSVVGDMKTDVASTRNGLQETRDKLDHAIGDMGLQSEQIARNHDELEQLKHRGERNYYEFTLAKGAHPTVVSTVGLQLKKVDPKRSTFTLNVTSDDRTIEKKDRTMFEPLQFYTSKDRRLYELVIFNTDKKTVSGYLSTPKEAVVAQAR